MGVRTAVFVTACWLGPALWSACSSEPQAVPPPGLAVPAAGAQAPAAPAQAPTIEPVGYTDLQALPKVAYAKNLAALKLHKKGKYAESRAGFEEVLKLAPFFRTARYNLACALARLGDLDGAAGQLMALLPEDLPAYRGSVGKDEDLATLRTAPQGQGIAARAAALEASWQEALRTGAPVVAYREMSGGGSPPFFVRAGVWVHAWGRFVPMGPPAANTLSSLFDQGRVLAVTGKLIDDGLPGFKTASIVFFRAPFGPEEGRAEKIMSEELFGAIHAGFIPEGVRFHSLGEEVPHLWQDVKGTSVSSETMLPAPPGPRLVVSVDGSILIVPPPPGFEVKGNKLVTPAGPVDLGKGHAATNHTSVVVSPDGKTAVVASSLARCQGGEFGVVRHFVDRVDLASRQVERLSEGKGSAAALVGPDGALYLQLGDALRRYPAPGAATFETLPAGVLLAVPMSPPQCGA